MNLKIVSFIIKMVSYFFVKLYKNKPLGFREIHDSVFEQKTLRIRVHGLWNSKSFFVYFKW